MKTFLATIFLFCLCPSASTQAQAKFQGRLITETGASVPNVELIPNNGQVTHTKKNGSFVIHFDPSVKAGDSTTIKLSPDWVICSQYRGRFVTVPESDSDWPEVKVARRGSRCVLTPANFVRLIQEVAQLKLKTSISVGQTQQSIINLVLDRKLRQELETKQAISSVFSGFSEETGVPFETLQAGVNQWARLVDRNDSDSAKAAKALYLGNWSQAEILAESAKNKHEREIDEQNKRTAEKVRAFILDSYVEVAAQVAQGKSAEVLKTLGELDRLFASGKVSKETFREEWGVSRLLVGVVKIPLAIEKLKNSIPLVPKEAQTLLSESMANQEEALAIFNEIGMPEAIAITQVMLGVTIVLSADFLPEADKTQQLSKALARLDSAAKVIRQPVPAACGCSPARWAQLQIALAVLLAEIGGRVAGEQNDLWRATAAAILDESYAAATDKSSRAAWAGAQALIGLSVFSPDGNSEHDDLKIKAGIGVLEKAITRVSKDELPKEWADLERMLALGYMRLANLPGGEGERNFAVAVTTYEQAALVLLKSGLRIEWAQSQSLFGASLLSSGFQATGDQGLARLARGVEIFEQLLKDYPGEKTSYEYALTQLQLGTGLSTLGQRMGGAEGETKLLTAITVLEKALTLIKPELLLLRARTQGELGSAHLALGHGLSQDREKHLVSAVTAFEEGLKAITQADEAIVWANLRANLGLALLGQGQMTEKDSERHLRSALKAFADALTVFDEKDYRLQWAQNQGNTGLAFLALAKNFADKRRENLIEARTAFEQALKGFSEKGSAIDRAQTEASLGWTKVDLALMVQDNPEQNLLAAVKDFDQALSALSEKYPSGLRVQAQTGKGFALLNLGQMFERDNELHLKGSVLAYEDALIFLKEKDSPEDWLETQGNLATALVELARNYDQERESRLARALDALQKLIDSYTEKDSPDEWAMAQALFGETHLLLAQTAQRDWKDHLAPAVIAFKRALKVFTVKGPPMSLARAQSELGQVLTMQGQADGARGERPFTEALGAFDQALVIYKEPAFRTERAQTQLYRAGVLVALGELTEGAEKDRLLNNAINASEESLRTFTVSAFPQQWADATVTRADAWVGMKHNKEAAKAYAAVHSADPSNGRAVYGLSYLQHEILFNYDDAFQLQGEWLKAHPELVDAQVDFAEKHFTTERFAECERMIEALLKNKGLDPNFEVGLRAIEIADLLALGQSASINSRLDSLIELVRAQPSDFQETWVFNGVTNFIGKQKKLARHRAWLLHMFAAVKAKDHDAMLNELKKVQADFKP